VSRFLLDVNVLIALIDAEHLRHEDAHQWLRGIGKSTWATCPITENGALRIAGSTRYAGSPAALSAVVQSMKSLLALSRHEFWQDDIRILASRYVDCARLLSSSQTTDTYLLALASAHSGKLATFDRRLVTDAVIGGRQALHLIS
jgi:toxin-antitoxin system PIN domain toxin